MYFVGFVLVCVILGDIIVDCVCVVVGVIVSVSLLSIIVRLCCKDVFNVLFFCFLD